MHTDSSTVNMQRRDPRGVWTAWIALGVCMVLIAVLSSLIQPQKNSRAGIMQYAELEDGDAPAVAALFGEFRAGVSYLLFIKTEQYLHSGIRYRPLTEKERELGREEIHHEETLPEDEHEEHEHGHSHGAQLVPSPQWDRRGIIGWLDRELHPYEAEGESVEHGDPKEMLPWYRLVTFANPRFVKAYVIGAFVIASYGDRLDEAERFLHEGLEMNPESIEINDALGRFLLHRKKDPAKGKPFFVKAIEIGRQKEFLSSEEEHSLKSAYSNLALLEWKSNGKPEIAEAVVKEGLERFPEDRALNHTLRVVNTKERVDEEEKKQVLPEI